jgi:hypothetical protein
MTAMLAGCCCILIAGCAHDPSRLHGAWRSDAERSMQWNRANAELTEKQDTAFSQIFGHMTVTYGPHGKGLIEMEPYTLFMGTNTHAMPGFTNTAQYKVVGQTESSLVVEMESDFMPDDRSTIHFDGPDVYWLHLNEEKPDTSAREYFRRTGGPNKTPEHISEGRGRPSENAQR